MAKSVGKPTSKAPDSSNVLANYLSYVKTISEITTEIVTAGLTKPKTIVAMHTFNKVYPKIMEGLINGIGYVQEIAKKIEDSNKMKSTLKNVRAILDIMTNINLKSIRELEKIGKRERIIESGVVAIGKIFGMLMDQFEKIGSGKNQKLIQKTVKNILMIEQVILDLRKVMVSCILMTALGVLAVPGLVVAMGFLALMVFLFTTIISIGVISIVSIKALNLMMKVVARLFLVALGSILLGAFIIKWWKLALVGITALLLTFVGIAMMMFLISLIRRPIQTGTKTLLWMTISLVVLSMGLVLVAYMMRKLREDDFWRMFGVVTISVGVFIILSKAQGQVTKGSLSVVIMSASIVMLAGALWLANNWLSELTLGDFVKLFAIMGVLVGVYSLVGLAIEFIAMGAAAIAILGASLFAFGLGLLMISISLKSLDAEAFSNLKEICTSDLITIYVQLAIFGPLIIAGTAVMGLMGGSLILFATGVVLSNKFLKKLNPENFKKLLDTVTYLMPTYTLLAITSPLIVIGTAMSGLIGASLTLFVGGLTLASKIGEHLNPKVFSSLLGIVKSLSKVYTRLSLLSFVIAPGIVTMTLIGSSLFSFAMGLLMVSKVTDDFDMSSVTGLIEKTKEIANAIVGIGFDRKKFKTAKKTLKRLRKITRNLCGIANDIGDIAKLQIADQWSKDGKPIHYRQLTETDFTDAVNNVIKITTLMLNAVTDQSFIDMVEQFSDDGPGKKPLRKLRDVTQSLSGIAMDIAEVAKLNIPNAWNKDGNPISYVKMDDAMFKEATDNVVYIMGTLVEALTDEKVQQICEDFDEDGAEVLGKYFEAVGHISAMADAVSKVAAMTIPEEWNKDGKAIKYRKITDDEFKKAKDNVKNIITGLGSAISDPNLKTIVEKMSKDQAEVLGEFFKSAGNVSGMVDVVVKLATGSYPIEFDERTGKAKKYGSFSDLVSGEGFTKVTNNITSIVSCLTNGIISAVENKKDAIEKAKQSIETVSQTVEPLSSLIDSVIKMYKEKAFKDFDKDAFTANVKGMFSAAISPFTDTDVVPGDAVSQINSKAAAVGTAVDVMKELAEVDSKKFNGNISKTVDATNKFLTKLNSVDAGKLSTMDRISKNMLEFAKSINGNFDALADALSQKLVKVLNDLNDTLDDVGQSIEDSGKAMTNLATAPTTVAAQTAPNKSKEEMSKESDKTRKQNEAMIIERLEKILTQLKSVNVNVKNSTAIPVEIK